MNPTPWRGPAALLLLAALSGCSTMGPDYRRPEVSLPPSFRHEPKNAQATVLAPPTDQWWTIFADPTLDALQADAVGHSPTLPAALAARDAALARRGLDRAARRPMINGSASATLAGESAERVIFTPRGLESVRETGDSYSLSVAAGYELDLWGRVRRLTERADAQVEASEADLVGVRLALAGDVAASYFRLRSSEAEARVIDQRLASQRETLRLRQSRRAGGFISEVEVARDEAELHALVAELADVRRRLDLEANVLALLTGRTAPLPASQAASLPDVPVGVPADLLRRRPDVRSAEAQLHARTAEIGAAQAARYPTILLTGGGGFSSTELDEFFNRPGQFWGVGPSLSMPLFDGGKSKSQVAAARAAAAQAEAGFRQQLLVACREVEDALVEARALAEREGAQQRSRDASAEVLRLTQLRYERGLVSYFEVLTAQRTVLDLERTLAALAGQRQLAAVRLVRALGGTWNT
jgi:NodT family efflux transporter outer membrane factor (OMF) lipoprotein